MTAVEPVQVRFRRLPHAADLPLPAPASAGSAGLDLRAAVDAETDLAPGQRLLVPSGFAVELPPGYEGQVRPRSGLAARHGVTVVNAPGTIDSDYRGEILVALVHLGEEPVVLRRGDRIAQLVVAPVAAVVVEEAPGLAETDRGTGGFGSTGSA
jgi:dUTP pyrophosphatase